MQILWHNRGEVRL